MNGRASGPVLQSVFLAVIDHSASHLRRTSHHHGVVEFYENVAGNGGSSHVDGVRIVEHDVESQELGHDDGFLILRFTDI